MAVVDVTEHNLPPPLPYPPNGYSFSQGIKSGRRENIKKLNPIDEHTRAHKFKQTKYQNRERAQTTKRRQKARTDEEAEKIFLTTILKAKPAQWDEKTKTLHTDIGPINLPNNQYDIAHMLWSKFVWQKVPLASSTHELAQKIESLSRGGDSDDIVFREYMRDVYESTNNDYFENLEQNQSKAARITNREPEDKS